MSEEKKYNLIEAAFCRPTTKVPVWFMRQAGRYLPEYRALRDRTKGFLDMCFTPEYAVEISLQPYEILGVDGVIMFSDILTPLIGMGVDLEFSPGPVINSKISTRADIDKLKVPDPSENTPYVGEILKTLRRELKGKVPVIGFAGAPATVGAYLMKDATGDYSLGLKKMMLGVPDDYHALMDKLTSMTINYLNYQIESGAEMIQLFDTWSGEFSAEMYNEFVLPYTRRIFDSLNLRGTVPASYFIKGTEHLLDSALQVNSDMLSIDWKASLPESGKAIDLSGKKVALQGNLDPAYLFASESRLIQEVDRILEEAKDLKGFIFNLGHGVLQHTPVDNVRLVIDRVQNFGGKK